MWSKCLWFLLVVTIFIMGIHNSDGYPAQQQKHDEKGANLERVQIRVYRGPTNEHENFAPWGFFVQQPADGLADVDDKDNDDDY